MTKNKINKLITTATSLVNKVGTDTIKRTIGDSVRNNRSVTVSQLVRYLNSTRSSKNRKLAKALRQVHEETKFDIYYSRILRTDAHSLTELASVLDHINSFQSRYTEPKKTILSLLRNV